MIFEFRYCWPGNIEAPEVKSTLPYPSSGSASFRCNKSNKWRSKFSEVVTKL
jgi:hypothetical protein